MTYSYDLSTTAGLIRLNTLQETDSADPILSDEALLALYTQESSSIKRASARVLEIIAANQLFILKVQQTLGFSTDGAAVARELRMQAASLREQAVAEEAVDEEDTFDIAEQVVNDFALRELLYKTGLRS